MILNMQNTNNYKLLLDLEDLKSLNIDVNSLCGNSQNINTYLIKILKKLDFNDGFNLSDIEIISFDFKIFYIFFSINSSTNFRLL